MMFSATFPQAIAVLELTAIDLDGQFLRVGE